MCLGDSCLCINIESSLHICIILLVSVRIVVYHAMFYTSHLELTHLEPVNATFKGFVIRVEPV